MKTWLSLLAVCCSVTPALADWDPVSSGLTTSHSRPVLDRAEKVFTIYVKLHNTSDSLIEGPLRLYVTDNVRELVNGQRDELGQYIDIAAGRLEPGERLDVPVRLAQSRGNFHFTTQVRQQTRPDDWTLVWQDEFSAPDIDTQRWSFEENCWGGGNNEQQCYTAREQNAFIEDGKLIIRALREDFTGADNPDGNSQSQRTLPYTSARLRSLNKGDWTYGRFEINARLPFGQGTWPAIWMLPSDYRYGSWAASGEIDIMEAVNLKASSDDPATPDTQENRIHGTLHYGRQWPGNVYSGAAYRLPGNINPADGFHEYAVEWEEGEIRWYVDDVHYATQTADGWYSQYQDTSGQWATAPSPAPFNERFHLLLNLAVGGSWAANVNEGGIDESVFPQQMAIDYVRVYECSINPVNGQGCATRGDNAQQIPGNPPPDIAPASRITGPQWHLFTDALPTGFTFDSYNPDGSVSYSLTESHGSTAVQITQTGSTGNLFITAPEPVDITDFGEVGVLTFDIKVTDNPQASDILIKTDSGWPAVADISIEAPVTTQWQTVSVDIKTLLANGNRYAPGNTADLSSVINPLVLEPAGPMTFVIDNIRYLFDVSEKSRISVFDDGPVAPFATGSYVASGNVDITTPVSEDSAYDIVSQFAFNTHESVVYFQAAADSTGAPTQFDLSQFEYIEFDLKVIEDPRSIQDFYIKMDCGHPCGSGDFAIDAPQAGIWTHYKISLNDLVIQPGSTLDLSRVDTPLVIFPAWGNQQGVVMQVDNIEVTRAGNPTSPPSGPVEISSPFALFEDTLAPYWTLWDCCANAQVTVNDSQENRTVLLDYFGPSPTVAGMLATRPHDISAGDISEIHFDFRMITPPDDASASILLKVESSDSTFAEVNLADYAGAPLTDGQWQTIVIPRNELEAQGLNLSKINLFLIFPEWGKATGAVLELDNMIME
ncbi:glycoside hydrolase family 16 protein [Salinimonas lutimaris]|uniref:glycoside hydrolase family 16 protein n=1 Tax=Salinimonas lutimaris TaxID=914153 RepID=UPI0010BF8E25|nr:glycoside hydrolase family 16 protein [Salinimonas lutimaris]